MRPRTPPIRLPSEEHIRARLAALVGETNELRRLLRIVRRKQPAAKPAKPEAANAR
jgi:hypothetical protein